MADMTILTAQPSIPLPPSFSTKAKTFPFVRNDSSRAHLPGEDMPASFASPASGGRQTNSIYLSPPVNTFKSPRRSRRGRSTERSERSSSTLSSDDEESAAEEDSAELSTSYTRSFRPFSYPSTASLEVTQHHNTSDLRRPQPPLCESFVTV